jgi:hypothetical protein
MIADVSTDAQELVGAIISELSQRYRFAISMFEMKAKKTIRNNIKTK